MQELRALRPGASCLDSKPRKSARIHPDVVEYLNTPFIKLTGNGNSDILLYKSIFICLARHDEATLSDVIFKAKSERWT